MKTKILTVLLAVWLLGSMSAAFALEAGEARAVIGGDLTEEQVQAVYTLFGVKRDSVKELKISIDEERQFLGDIVDEDRIGQRSISCVYIEILPAGSGLDIRTENITWCSTDMYRSALSTAGITDARVIVAAPWAVSGTGGIAGIYKAYEDISGKTLDETSKNAGTEELVAAAELADSIGAADALHIINDLKKLLSETENMSDEEILREIRHLAEKYDVSISDTQAQRLLKLCRSFRKLRVEDLKSTVQSVEDTVKRLTESGQKASGFVQSVKSFFRSVLDFFSRLFKKFA